MSAPVPPTPGTEGVELSTFDKARPFIAPVLAPLVGLVGTLLVSYGIPFSSEAQQQTVQVALGLVTLYSMIRGTSAVGMNKKANPSQAASAHLAVQGKAEATAIKGAEPAPARPSLVPPKPLDAMDRLRAGLERESLARYGTSDRVADVLNEPRPSAAPQKPLPLPAEIQATALASRAHRPPMQVSDAEVEEALRAGGFVRAADVADVGSARHVEGDAE